MPNPNLPLLEYAASRLIPFLDEIVFVGGVTLGLLITDAAAAPIRGTDDVDVIAEITTYIDYIAFSDRLRKANFSEDAGEEPIACRWRIEGLTLDVLPLSKDVLGYTNIWYEGALKSPISFGLPGGQTIKVIAAPFFLGTKMEAFRGRGNNDFLSSHDLEDFIAVIEGRPTILLEVAECEQDLRVYLARAATALLNEPRFVEVLPGYVLDEGRVPLILQRLTEIASHDARS
jgi:hypothetical protein